MSDSEIRQQYDMRTLKEEDRITLDLGGDGPWLTPYRIAVQKAIICCSRGGTVVLRIPSTYLDPIHPIFTLTIIGNYKDVDVTTSFIIYKLDSYFSGYCFHDKNKDIRDEDIAWYMCSGRRIHLSKEKEASFGLTYEPIKISELKDQMGRETLLRALYLLKSEKSDVRQQSFNVICQLFAEPVRFTSYYKYVGFGMMEGENYVPKNALDPNIWETLSRNVVFFSRNLRFCEGDLVVLQRLGINSSNFRSRIKLLLMEDPIAKLEWKQQLRRKYPEIEKKSELTIPIKRKSAQILGSLSKQKKTEEELMNLKRELENQQNQIIENLISSGGIPDIWINIVRALREPEDYICTLIIENSDLYVASPDLSHCYDFYGYDYFIAEADMSILRSFVDLAGA